MKFKWLSFLKESDKKIEAYESWVVWWTAWHAGMSLANPIKQAEVFTSVEDAEIFVESLKAARKLLRDTSLEWEIRKMK